MLLASVKLHYVGRTLIIDASDGWLIMIIVDGCSRSVVLLLSGTMVAPLSAPRAAGPFSLTRQAPRPATLHHPRQVAPAEPPEARDISLAGGSVNEIRCAEGEKAAA